MLELIFKKGKGKPDTISRMGTDGSATWAKLHRGMAYHDLAHYAVESVIAGWRCRRRNHCHLPLPPKNSKK